MAKEGATNRLARLALTALVAAASALTISAIASETSVGEPAARLDAGTAKFVESKLASMDLKLDKLIKTVDKKGAEKVDVYDKSIPIRSDKQELAEQIFVDAFSTFEHLRVFKRLDQLDEELATAQGYLEAGGKSKGLKNRIDHALTTSAPQALTELEDELKATAPDTPDGVFGALAGIGKKVKKLGRAWSKDDLSAHDLEKGAKEIERDKIQLVAKYYDNRIFYGVKFVEFFRDLDCVDARLEEAGALDFGSHGNESEAVEKLLKQARECKEHLEAEVKETLNAPLSISPINANFVEAQRSTTYTVVVDEQPDTEVKYQWSLTLQAVDPNAGVDQGCTNRGVFGATTVDFVWHHGNTGDTVSDDGCDHNLQGQYGHQGLIGLIVSDNRGWKCTATYKGTNTSDANSVQNGVASAPDCKRD
jgi:hypothetical protein